MVLQSLEWIKKIKVLGFMVNLNLDLKAKRNSKRKQFTKKENHIEDVTYTMKSDFLSLPINHDQHRGKKKVFCIWLGPKGIFHFSLAIILGGRRRRGGGGGEENPSNGEFSPRQRQGLQGVSKERRTTFTMSSSKGCQRLNKSDMRKI